MSPQYLFELSGEHKTMCSAEAKSVIRAETDTLDIQLEGPGYIVASFDEGCLDGIADRISLTHRIGRYLGSFDVDDLSGFSDISIPEGSFAIKGKRFEGMMSEIDSQDVIRKLGANLSKTNDVNLKHPDHEVWILMSDRLHVFLGERAIDRNIMETRKVGERPFFSPISLHPKYARALINLTGVKKGGIIIDPFCGTGGIPIEAAFMGMRAIASDFDPEMIAGTIENMDYYGLKLHDSDVVDIGDIAGRFGELDAVATDPPYGRSTHTGGEDIDEIYRRAALSFREVLKPGCRAGMVLPHVLSTDALVCESIYVQRVHKSLSRHYHVLRRE